MIFNLVKYLRDSLPALTFISIADNVDSDEGTIVTDTGGVSDHNFDKKDFAIQLMTKSKSLPSCQQDSTTIYNLLENVFNLTLPTVTVNSVVYPEIRTYRLVPVQTPGYIGVDSNGLHMYSFNIIVTTK